MALRESEVRELAGRSTTRPDLWVALVQALDARAVAEIGVYRGDFAARLLALCPSIVSYYMIDPWRHLPGWNKPANQPDDVFERFFEEAMEKTSAQADKRIVLRGTTSEVAGRIPDQTLDFAYIDGDHTLHGIAIDLVRLYPKVREGGCIGGDDFRPSVWQHGEAYEPSFVFPYAVYFAEAVGARIYGLPHAQFLLEKTEDDRFDFIDLTGRYRRTDVRSQLMRRPLAARLRRWVRAAPSDRPRHR